MRKRAIGIAVALCLVTLGACTHDGPAPDEARLVPDGTVEVAAPGGSWAHATGPRTLARGTRVRVLDGGARLELTGGGRVELRKGSRVAVGRVTSLLAGDLLATAGDRPVTVEGDETRVRLGAGAAHVARSLAFTTAVYEGAADVQSRGRELTVPALRQAAVPAPGLLPLRPSPLRYDPRDAWDRRFLGGAIDLGRELLAKSRGFTGQLRPGEGRTPGFYRLVIPALDRQRAFDESRLDGRSPGELLVGAAITVQGTHGTFAQRWDAVFAFRDAGAEWGLVARDQGVSRAPLLAEVDAAIGRATQGLVFAPPTGPGPGGGPSPSTTTTTTTLLPPPPPIDPVVQTVNQILGSLLP